MTPSEQSIEGRLGKCIQLIRAKLNQLPINLFNHSIWSNESAAYHTLLAGKGTILQRVLSTLVELSNLLSYILAIFRAL